MTIKRDSSNVLTIQGDIKVVVKVLDGSIVVSLNDSNKTIDITKPGDYEYFGVSITSYDVPQEEVYDGKVELVQLYIEGVVLVYTSDKINIPKEIITNLANIDILLLPAIEVSLIKSSVVSMEPKKLVLVDKFDNNGSCDIESLKKTLGVLNVLEGGSAKYKHSDFEITTEEVLSEIYILS